MDIPVSPKFEAYILDLAAKLLGPNPNYSVGMTENKRYGFECYLFIKNNPYVYTNQHAFKFRAQRKLIKLIRELAALNEIDERREAFERRKAFEERGEVEEARASEETQDSEQVAPVEEARDLEANWEPEGEGRDSGWEWETDEEEEALISKKSEE